MPYRTLIAQQIALATGQPVTEVSCSAILTPQQLLGGLLPVGESGRFELRPSRLLQALQTGGTVVLDELDCAPVDVIMPLVGLVMGFPAATVIATVAYRKPSQYAGRTQLDPVVAQYIVVVSQ